MTEADNIEDEDPVKTIEKALEIPEKIVQELPPAYQKQFERLWDKLKGDDL